MKFISPGDIFNLMINLPLKLYPIPGCPKNKIMNLSEIQKY